MAAKDPKNRMDYQEIFFVGNSLMDDQDFVDMVKSWHNERTFAKAIVVQFYSGLHAPEAGVPFSIEGAAHYSVGEHVGSIRRDLPNYQLILTVSGEAHIWYDGAEYLSTAGTAMIVDCRLPHAYHVMPGKVWEYKHIHFHAPQGQALLSQCLGFTAHSGRSEQFFDELIAYANHESRTAPFVYSNIIGNILTELLEQREKEKTSAEDGVQMTEIARYLREHFEQDLSVADVAQQYYLSVYHLIKSFKRYYGETPHQYLTRYRINRAKELLLMGHTVEDTAFACGFGSLNNFYRAFKMSCSTTPRSFVNDVSSKTKTDAEASAPPENE